jgi:RNA polymerase sigma factor (sigma-70 family)
MSCPIRRRWAVPTQEEERELLSRAQSGDSQARDDLITRNLPFVIKTAQENWNYRGVSWLELDDFIQAASMGLIHAIKKWDLKKAKGRFMGYAKHWMRNYIDKEIHYSQSFRVPLGTQQAIKEGTASQEVCEAAERFKVMATMEMFGESEDLNFYLMDDSDIPADIELKEELDLLQRHIDALPQEERNLLERRFRGDTLKSIGVDHGLSRERIRQLETKIKTVLTVKMRRELFPEEFEHERVECDSQPSQEEDRLYDR